jgi:hypothetical protein
MVEIHNKYDLRPRENTYTTNPPKNLLARNKANEVVVPKSTTEVQATQIKQVETKAMQTKKMENKKLKFKPKNWKNKLACSILRMN